MNEPAPRIRRQATYQDVLDAPPNMVAELVNGTLHLHPRPASRHARASFKVAGRLDDPFENGIGTRRFDLTEKRDLYGARGVAYLWLVDPGARTLEAFALRGGAWVLIAALADDAEVRVAPFEAIGFPLSALWPE